GPEGPRGEGPRLPQLRRKNTKRHELRSSHQEAWHPGKKKKPGPGRGLVTRRARASALPQGDGKPEQRSGKPTPSGVGGRHPRIDHSSLPASPAGTVPRGL